ncbi:uncharacterized protein [Solanum lycopersicum]|uniref:uncharacterized protein n=1 Tax=Solanum lycopersicum TaxID=4081 RepID=UPI003748F50B
MNRFVKGVSNDLMEDCRTAMLHDNMSISRLMLHAQQVEESRLKMKNRGFKREKAYEGDTSKRKLEIKDKPKFKKRFSNKAKGRESNQFQVSSPSSNAPKKNRFYALHSKGEQEDYPDVMTGSDKCSPDPGATLSFVTPLVAKNVDLLLDVFVEPFSVTIPVGDSIMARRVFRSFPTSLPNRVT